MSQLKQFLSSLIAAILTLATAHVPAGANQPERSLQAGWHNSLLLAQSYYWEPEDLTDEQEADYILEEIERDFDGYLDEEWYVEELKLEIIEALSDEVHQTDLDDATRDAYDLVGEIPDEIESDAFDKAVEYYYDYESTGSTSGPVAQLTPQPRRLPSGGRLKPSNQTVSGRRIAARTASNIAQAGPPWPRRPY